MDFATTLRNAGLKVTGTRLALLELIEKENRHMTADEITQGLHDANVSVDRVTIYRNIERLIKERLLITIHLPGRALHVGLCKRPNDPHHHHVVCISCGQVSETNGCLVLDHWDELRGKIKEETSFELTDHILQYVGLCPDCKNKSRP